MSSYQQYQQKQDQAARKAPHQIFDAAAFNCFGLSTMEWHLRCCIEYYNEHQDQKNMGRFVIEYLEQRVRILQEQEVRRQTERKRLQIERGREVSDKEVDAEIKKQNQEEEKKQQAEKRENSGCFGLLKRLFYKNGTIAPTDQEQGRQGLLLWSQREQLFSKKTQ